MSCAKSLALYGRLYLFSVVLAPRFRVYEEVSDHLREIFSDFSDCAEPLSSMRHSWIYPRTRRRSTQWFRFTIFSPRSVL